MKRHKKNSPKRPTAKPTALTMPDLIKTLCALIVLAQHILDLFHRH